LQFFIKQKYLNIFKLIIIYQIDNQNLICEIIILVYDCVANPINNWRAV